jgi:hypothetical protein
MQQDFIRPVSKYSRVVVVMGKRMRMRNPPSCIWTRLLSGTGTRNDSSLITARVIHQLVDYYTAVGLVSYASS